MNNSRLISGAIKTLPIGNLSNGMNRNPFFSNLGLQYLCNLNTDNNTDFAVPLESGTNEGIAANQGSNQMAAGNAFSHRPFPLSLDFNNSSAWPVFYWYDEQVPEEEPINYVGIAKEEAEEGSGCSGSGPEIPEVKELTEGEKADLLLYYNSHSTAYDQSLASYNALMDGGDTDELLNTIGDAAPADSIMLYNSLMNYAPYLSEPVLFAAADITNVLSHSRMKNILISTADEARKPSVIKYMQQKADPLPEGMISEVLAKIDTATIRTEHESDLSLYAMRKDSVANRMIIDYLMDTTTIHYDSIRIWLERKGSFESELAIVDAYLSEMDTTSAKAYLDSIPANGLTSSQTTELGHFKSLKYLQIAWMGVEKTLMDLDSNDVNQLLNIANTHSGLGAQQAKNILEFAYGYDFYVPPVFPDTQASQQFNRPFFPTADQLIAGAMPVRAIPNPAKDKVQFAFQITDNSKKELHIFDINGRLIKQFTVSSNETIEWNTSYIAPGVYLYGLKTNGGYKALQRLVISK